MIKNPQAKGKRAEYMVRDALKRYGFEAVRNPMSGAIEWLKGDLTTNFPFFLEVKNVEKSEFLKWYKKAADQSDSKPPMIIWTKNNEQFYCFVALEPLLYWITRGSLPKFTKPQNHKHLSLDETSGLKYSKSKQLHEKE